MTRTSRTILADTSAWGELYRKTGSPIDLALTQLLTDGSRLSTTEPIFMELLSARRPIGELARLRQRLLSLRMLRVGGLETFEQAAVIHRVCRSNGETIRSSIDCLIAAVAVREGASVLAADNDFEAIARHTSLRLEPV